MCSITGKARVMTKLQTKQVPFTFNRGGYYYFSRRVPTDLVEHYVYPRVVQSLKTKTPSVARSRSLMLATKLDEHWSYLRLAHCDLPAKHLLKSQIQLRSQPTNSDRAVGASMSLSEALSIYVAVKGAAKGKTFQAAAERACGYLVDACGLKDLHEYSRADALAFRDALIARGLAGSSVSRVFNSVTAVFNFAVSEHALPLTNPFTRIYHDKSAGVVKRLPVPNDDLRKVQALCRAEDDDVRWLVALVSDTGLRLAEAAGILLGDIKLDVEVPHVAIQKNSFRSLKTEGSERLVPLVGSAFWAACRLRQQAISLAQPAFPRYNKMGSTNANSASAALNKWLRPHVPAQCTMHSFRHSMRDRLRAVNCPTEMIDQIGGWSHDSIGKNYGAGYPLGQLERFMKQACEVVDCLDGHHSRLARDRAHKVY